jgi:DNA-directed RNA polymerase beta' subunit
MIATKVASFVQFSTLTPSEWQAYGFEITEPSSNIRNGKGDYTSTPYDPRFGVINERERCIVCGLSNTECAGHFGYINLPEPLIIPEHLNIVKDILMCICDKCSKVRMTEEQMKILGLLKIRSTDRVEKISEMCNKKLNVVECPHCGNKPLCKYGVKNNSIIMFYNMGKTITIKNMDSVEGAEKENKENNEGDKNIEEEEEIVNKKSKGKGKGKGKGKSKAKGKGKDENVKKIKSNNFVTITPKQIYGIFMNVTSETMRLLGFNLTLSKNPMFMDASYITFNDKEHVHEIRPESYIMSILPVVPLSARPSMVKDDQRKDDDITDKYNVIIKLCKKIKGDENVKRKKKKDDNNRKKLVEEMHNHVITLMNNKKVKAMTTNIGRPYKGFCDRLRGKEGHILKHCLTKRSDESMRDVIVPGGRLIPAGYIGVYDELAKIVTHPERVVPYNLEYLQKLLNDRKVYRVRRDRCDFVVADVTKNYTKQFYLKPGDILDRHLINGDPFVFNRQPTLRVESMQGMNVITIKDKTFRVPLSVMKPFNADCDGDEMNGHFPQSIGSISDTMNLMDCPKNIVSGQHGAPIIGSIQNALIGMKLLTNSYHPDHTNMNYIRNVIGDGTLSKDGLYDCMIPIDMAYNLLFTVLYIYKDYKVSVKEYMTKEEERLYNSVVNHIVAFDDDDSINDRLNDFLSRAYEYYPESIDFVNSSNGKKIYFFNRKFGSKINAEGREEFDPHGSMPITYVSGKLIASITIPSNITKEWKTDGSPHRPIVKIKNGIILPDSGPVCKKVIGSSKNSIVHILYKYYSPECCLKFISEIDSITNRFIPMYGFSMSISDCIPTDVKLIKTTIANAMVDCSNILMDGLKNNDEKERDINKTLNNVMNVAPAFSKKYMNKGEANSLIIMKTSGAKGSDENNGQISGFLGQQNLDGKRIPTNISNESRCCSYFKPGDNSPEARGFIENNYLYGMSDNETWFHAVAGRQGVIDTAIKTAETGYNQKKIVKKLEDKKVYCDLSVRDCKKNIIEFLYGYDGMNPKHLVTIENNQYPFFVNVKMLASLINTSFETEVRAECLKNSDGLDYKDTLKTYVKRSMIKNEVEYLLTFIRSGMPMSDNEIIRLSTKNVHMILADQISTVEIYETKIPTFSASIVGHFERSKAQYGDMCGYVASCSIGEIATQLTLNFFHEAGKGDKDVSQGVPKFKELLNVTKNPAKPFITAKLNEREICGHQSFDKMIKGEKKSDDIDKDLKKSLNFGYSIEDINLANIATSYRYRYKNNDFDPDVDHEILDKDIIRYHNIKMYEEKDWIRIYRSVNEKEDEFFTSYIDNGYIVDGIDVGRWVIEIKFDMLKLLKYKISLQHLCNLIDEKMKKYKLCTTKSIPSPLFLHRINVHIFLNMKECDKTASKNRKRNDMNIFLDDGQLFFVIKNNVLDKLKTIKVQGIPNIKRTGVEKNYETKQWDVIAYGTNFGGLLINKYVDAYNTACDSCWPIYKKFGIETTRKYLIKEMLKIICFDGSGIDVRHVALLVDSMCHTGIPTSVNRYGITNDTGPISKDTFEKQTENLFHSSTHGYYDPLNSIPANVLYGKAPENAGANCVHIIDPDKIPL